VSRSWAIFAVCVFGLNHTFVMISRQAMLVNGVVLVEVIALSLLLLGLRKGHAFATFVGSVVAGLGFYVYFPGRAIFIVWALFLLVLALWFRREVGVQKLVRLAAVAVGGFLLAALPHMVAYAKASDFYTAYQRESLLVYHSGRVHQQDWVHASSEFAGIAKNIEYGLTAFNRALEDHAYIYQDVGHGIVDPLTGVLLWVGVVVTLVCVIRRRSNPWSLLPLVGFVALWLIFAFVVNLAPNYPRMLLMLPLVAYLVTMGVRAAALAFGRLTARPGGWTVATVGVAAVVAIGLWNGVIARDYIDTGRAAGNDIGSTGRYVESHRSIPGERFYIAADETRWNYYVWGPPSMMIDRLHVFAKRDSQVGDVISPGAVGRFAAAPPFALFMRRDLWARAKDNLETRYPRGGIRNITPDGRLVVFEVPSAPTA
jgi:hypothetical protein